MSRRLVWLSLGIVAAVLIGVSQLSNPDGWRELLLPVVRFPWRDWLLAGLQELRAGVAAHPRWGATGAGLLLVVLVIALWRRKRRRRPRPGASVPFEKVLADVLQPPNAAAGAGRPQRVADLARAGHPVGEIARMTRLSQDAVRALLARRA